MRSSQNNDVSNRNAHPVTKQKSRFKNWKENMFVGALVAFSLIFIALLITGIVLGSGGAAVPGALAAIIGVIASATGTGIGGGIGIFSMLVIAAMGLAGGVATLIGGLCHCSESDDLDMEYVKPESLDYNPLASSDRNLPVNHFGSRDPFFTPPVGITGFLAPTQSFQPK